MAAEKRCTNTPLYIKLPCRVGDTVYFTGNEIVEAMRVIKIIVELTEDIGAQYSYIEAQREDGTTECIGFNMFGRLVFTEVGQAEHNCEVYSGL